MKQPDLEKKEFSLGSSTPLKLKSLPLSSKGAHTQTMIWKKLGLTSNYHYIGLGEINVFNPQFFFHLQNKKIRVLEAAQ